MTQITEPPLLVVVEGAGWHLRAEEVADAIGDGLRQGGRPDPDLCPLAGPRRTGEEIRELLEQVDFDRRMRRARGVVLAPSRLDRHTLCGSLTFEVAARARQGGVPADAIVYENQLDAFDARIMDLQVILTAVDHERLVTAGRVLATLV